jgi:hypothetical protein
MIAGAAAAIAVTSASGPGLAGLTPAQILKTSLAAARQAGSGHLTLVIKGRGATVEFAVNMGAHGGTATFTEGASKLKFLVANHDIYLSGNEQYWSPMGAVDLNLTRLDGRWLWAPADDGSFVGVTGLVSTTAVVDDYLALLGKITGPPSSAHEGSTIALQGLLPSTNAIDETPGGYATLSVSTTAPYYPTRLVYMWPTGAASVVISFSGWGEKVAPSAPPGATALSSLDPSLFGSPPRDPPAQSDTAAQSDLQTAFTGTVTYNAENNGTFAGLDPTTFTAIDTGLTAVPGSTGSTGPSVISLYVNDNYVVLTAWAPGNMDCWGIIDNTVGISVDGMTGPGTFYVEMPSISSYFCTASVFAGAAAAPDAIANLSGF